MISCEAFSLVGGTVVRFDAWSVGPGAQAARKAQRMIVMSWWVNPLKILGCRASKGIILSCNGAKVEGDFIVMAGSADLGLSEIVPFSKPYFNNIFTRYPPGLR